MHYVRALLKPYECDPGIDDYGYFYKFLQTSKLLPQICQLNFLLRGAQLVRQQSPVTFSTV